MPDARPIHAAAGTGTIALVWLLILVPAASAQEPRAVPSSPMTRAEQEAFLLHATIVTDPGLAPGAKPPRRISLTDGRRTHDASIETDAGAAPSTRDYRLNVAAYELDKALELGMVVPTVARTVSGQPALITWWIDDVAMSEVSRRKSGLEPPDPDRWTAQMHAVRVFDELIANVYRSMSPSAYLSTVWDNLLITKDWIIKLIDHTRTFQTRRQLESPETLTRCDRRLLARLRQVNQALLKERLAPYLTPDQLDALEVRRRLLVDHFDDEIRKRGEAAVLYDLPPRH